MFVLLANRIQKTLNLICDNQVLIKSVNMHSLQEYKNTICVLILKCCIALLYQKAYVKGFSSKLAIFQTKNENNKQLYKKNTHIQIHKIANQR